MTTMPPPASRRHQFRPFLFSLLALAFLPTGLHIANAEAPPMAWVDEVKKRCPAPAGTEEWVMAGEFSGRYSLDDLLRITLGNYLKGKRLKDRAFWDSAKNQLILPVRFNGFDQATAIPFEFIYSIAKHIESALRLKYVDAIAFPDMGHSHFLLPKKFFSEKISPIPNDRKDLLYRTIVEEPSVKIVYHTAERLMMMDENDKLLTDRHLQWRFYTRNPVGENRPNGILEIYSALDHLSNTVAEDQAYGHQWYGAGFQINASKDGCFPYQSQGKTFYFDLSLTDLPYGNNEFIF
ncbi:MAG: hypothetical protein H6624_20330 [Bdellovibrionaceae bacterium]|nr:hypothetical protein [Bdellovibrionales bacterium]MCB9086701.1 hypothetical protein [Pseudobdellovibrionaceae bacterium]